MRCGRDVACEDWSRRPKGKASQLNARPHLHRYMSYNESRSRMMMLVKSDGDDVTNRLKRGVWGGFSRWGWVLTPFIGGSFS